MVGIPSLFHSAADTADMTGNQESNKYGRHRHTRTGEFIYDLKWQNYRVLCVHCTYRDMEREGRPRLISLYFVRNI